MNTKTKKRSFVALMATLAVGTAAVAGLAFGASGMSNIAHAESVNSATSQKIMVHAETDENIITIGQNKVSLLAGESKTLKIDVSTIGNYVFSLKEGHANFDINGKEFALNAESTSFEVYLEEPNNAVITVSSDVDVELEFVLSYYVNNTNLSLGANTVDFVANEVQGAVIKGESILPAGYYTFEYVTGVVYFEFTYSGLGDDVVDADTVVKTYVLNADNPSFTVYLEAPNNTVIPMYAKEDLSATFNISYTATVVEDGVLVVGNNEVKADGAGIEYSFTNFLRIPATYTLSCSDSNAFIMVELTYEDETYGPYSVWEWVEDNTFTFTLNFGESINFSFATNNWLDDTYTVNIVLG